MPKLKLNEAERKEKKRLRERMRKAMIKSDPVLKEEYLKKDRERIAKRKAAGLLPSRKEMTEKERRIKQKQDRIRSRAYYYKKKIKAIAEEIAELKNGSKTNDVTVKNELSSIAPILSESDGERGHQRPLVSSTQNGPSISQQGQDSSESRQETPESSLRQKQSTAGYSFRQRRSLRQQEDTSVLSLQPMKDNLERFHRQSQGTPERSFGQRQGTAQRALKQREDPLECSLRQRQGTPEHSFRQRENTPDRHQINNQNHEEKWDLIGRSITVQLRDLEKSQRTVAHKLINDVMYYAESGLLNPACAITLGLNNEPENQVLELQDNRSFITLNDYETEDVKDKIWVSKDPLVP